MASSPEKCNMLWAVLEQPVLVLACAYASCELNSVQEVTAHHSGLQGTENVCALPICKLMHAYMCYTTAVLVAFWGRHMTIGINCHYQNDHQICIDWRVSHRICFAEWGRCLFWVCR